MIGGSEPDFVLIDPQASSDFNKTTTNIQGDDDYQDEAFFFANGNNKKQVTLGAYDAKNLHLTVVPGLNLKGKCKNQNCPAYRHQASWIRCGYGTFQFPRNLLNHCCQSCGGKIPVKSIKSMGYSRAKVVMTGLKLVGDNEVDVKEEFVESKGKFIYFRDQDQDIQEFLCLTIKVTKL